MMETQQKRILDRLREGGLNSYIATYEMRIKQAPTRIKELKEAGYKIVSRRRKDRSVDWLLWKEGELNG
jgi:hypothetical protein